MFIEDNDNVPDTSETTHQKPKEDTKQRTQEEDRKISEEISKGESTEADDG